MGETNEPFGVVNVGDAAKLAKKCDEAGLTVRPREFADSLFHRINEPGSRIHVVVGAKKFTEGWNSWRVSSMGLMNVGRGEGSQIIQLFGRGVRLKGRDMSLKRSSADRTGVGHRPTHLDRLETLHVFGVRAGYMAQFRDFLKEEGLAVDPVEEFVPIRVPDLPSDLKVIRLAESVAGDDPAEAFRRVGPRFALRTPWDETLSEPVRHRLITPNVALDWRPHVQTIESEEGGAWGDEDPSEHEATLLPHHLALVDRDALCLSLQRFKRERGWHGLTISKSAVCELLEDDGWYRLRIPAGEMRFDGMRKLRMWQDIALALLKKYVTRYYGARRQAWEAGNLEYRTLDTTDANFPMVLRETGEETGYRVRTEEADLDKLRTLIEGMRLNAEHHLYTPLLITVHTQSMIVSPPALNEGEQGFVTDFEAYCSHSRPERFRLHLLRNMSRGHGIGFFEANNFHPDFILWAVSGDRQHIAFVDPKGMVRVEPDDAKVRFARRIKDIQTKLGDPTVRLDSFLLSVTPFDRVHALWGGSKKEWEDRHVLFMEGDAYIGEMLRRMDVR